MDRELQEKTRQQRIAAYATFFSGLGMLVFGVLTAMYYGSAAGVVVSLLLAAGLFVAAFLFGGLGWSRFETGETIFVREEPPLPESIRTDVPASPRWPGSRT